jgi:hypothetical protein
MRFVAGAGCRGFAPAPPGFIAWCLSRCWGSLQETDEKGDAESIPPYRSVEATESALGLLLSIALSSAQFGLILLRRDQEAHLCGGFGRDDTKPWGKVVQAKNHLPPKEVLSMLSNNVKYIGLDVHKEAVAIAVLNGAGKLVMESIVETKASTLLDFLHGLRGELHVTLEEGTWAAWLYDVLRPHVADIVVCNPRRNALLKEGSKSDKIDARRLAELLRSGMLRAVYHG